MREKNRKPIESVNKFPQFITMNVIDGQAGLIIYSGLIFYSLTIDNILNIIILLILAGISIATLGGENGLFTRAKEAREKTAYSQALEELNLKIMDVQTVKRGQATLQDIVEALKEDEEYTYIVNLPETAFLSNQGEIVTDSDIAEKITDDITSIIVMHKNYEFEIDSNLKVSYTNNEDKAPIKKTYKITYNLQGGTSDELQNQIKTEGETLTLNSQKPKKGGYTFKGWAVEAGSSTISYQPASEFTVDEDITLYAVWEDLYLFKNGTFGAGLDFNNITYVQGQINGVPFVLKDGTIQRTLVYTGVSASQTNFNDTIQINSQYAKLRIKYSVSHFGDAEWCWCKLIFTSLTYTLPLNYGEIQTVETDYIPINGSAFTLAGCDGNTVIYEIDIIDEKETLE